ncbi:sialate O-acetylesterase [Chitinophagaceae bacterium LB-8]|uniref:Sialate O-acetylesterase n=1 Tax=Paraflavisolibacter caeni TaxID=2982496 RepID=A0A9X3BK60_9BACT|nr:sialate O-acetylesterase [Paraflavisolibacter caeni]MCU7552233.1 sialate O-acetylesterase [Paraflavisolibacter caeni]
MRLRTLSSLLLLLASTTFIQAQVRLPKVLGSNMVLQREKTVPVWGWATPGEMVTVSFSGQQKTTKADAAGNWKVVLSPLKASDKPQEMTITASNTITLSNILVGEVWLCSGQSNMEYTMKLPNNYAKPKKGVDSAALELTKTYPNIRIFKVEKVLSSPDVTTTGWNECSGKALAQFSAAGFYFAKNIQSELNMPIGVISSSWGGSRIEPWTPAEAYKALPAFAAEGGKTPFMIDSVAPGMNYKSMIQPLAPFAIRGFLWYQGESNCLINDGIRYADKMQALIEGWRKQWGNDNLPFYSVQIAPFYYSKNQNRIAHTPETLPEFWEGQTQALKIPNTGMAVVTDLVDTLTDIHPSYKWEVGRRLALLSMANDYNKKVVSSGPVFRSMKVKNGKAVLSFKYADGLKSMDNAPLNWFTIAGNDGKFVPATAEIHGQKIIVSAPEITKPAAVRFAWNEAAMPNLYNGAGLPAVPFRTDAVKWKVGS